MYVEFALSKKNASWTNQRTGRPTDRPTDGPMDVQSLLYKCCLQLKRGQRKNKTIKDGQTRRQIGRQIDTQIDRKSAKKSFCSHKVYNQIIQ
jgi:hypothetical protein